VNFTAADEARAIVNDTNARTASIIGATALGKRKLERMANLLHTMGKTKQEPALTLNLSSNAPARSPATSRPWNFIRVSIPSRPASSALALTTASISSANSARHASGYSHNMHR
jgi:hypothetical protein